MTIFPDGFRPEAALIDMDGTLYDSMPNHSRAWMTMCGEQGLGFTPEEFFLLEGCTGAHTIDLIMLRERGRHATEEEKAALYRRKTEIFASLPPVSVMPGAPEMLATLRRFGIRRVLVTGSGQNTLLGRIETDFSGIFLDGMRVTSRDVSRGKPHPEPYLRGAAIAGVDPGRCLVIENAPMGVEAGVAAGCFTVAVTTGPIPEKAMTDAGAHFVARSMPEFARLLEESLS